MTTEYRVINGFPNYEIGSDGTVWSTQNGERYQKTLLYRDGYVRVQLWHNGKMSTPKVHTLVLRAFVGPRPDDMVCCHRDTNGENNALDNLRWDTPKANMHDSIVAGKISRGSRHRDAKLTEADIPAIISAVNSGESRRSVAKRYGVSHSSIIFIVNGKTWNSVPRKEPRCGLCNGLGIMEDPQHGHALRCSRCNGSGTVSGDGK